MWLSQVLRTVNFRDVVPKVPGISEDELEGKTIEDDGSEYLGSLKAVGRISKELWRFVISHKSVYPGFSHPGPWGPFHSCFAPPDWVVGLWRLKRS